MPVCAIEAPGRPIEVPGSPTEVPGSPTEAPGSVAEAPGSVAEVPGRAVEAPGRVVEAPGRVVDVPVEAVDVPVGVAGVPVEAGQVALPLRPPPCPAVDTDALPATTTRAEEAYLGVVRRVLATGTRKTNRTGTDTISSFAEHYTVDLAEGYPLLTTKTVAFRSMLHETLWYLSGADHIRDLRRHTGIWDAWADGGGDLETAYGRFWRRFPVPEAGAALGGEVWAGADHPNVTREADGSLSFDQLGYVVDTLRRSPESRRLVVSAWHPANAAVSRLPPCHYTFCFNVEPSVDGPARLHCHLTQRSADLALGVPFNLACYALLTQVVAGLAGLRPGRFAHTLVDAHVYVDHVEGLNEQLARTPAPAPRLTVAPHPDGRAKGLDELTADDFALAGYAPQPAIRFPVAV